ncbi:MAG: hypothetical protein QOD99_2809 [Chthoniobacter sp.]|jgi:uncharacterized membrane protein YsdA (DUF1294 family)/cold shock CspA family protein|nr:hypothetical protein [Chthoniobacter sp.]
MVVMADLLTARLIKWNAQKGHGFLRVGRQSVFLHRRDFALRLKEPEVGDLIRFSLGSDRMGRTCALNAVYAGLHSQRMQQPAPKSARFAARRRSPAYLVLLVGLLLAPTMALHKLALHPGATLASAVGLSVITYVIYALDKTRAQAGHWRIPEMTLHLLAFAGGWPGAFVAQRRLRHKCSKTRFQIVFCVTVAVHQLVAADYLTEWKISHAASSQLLEIVAQGRNR